MAVKISCVIITLNEEQSIRRSLTAVNWCDEIIVVDCGSDDKTVEICHEFGCKVYHKDFDGYGEQKRYAVSLAKNDWVLNIDADEVVSNELKKEIENILSAEKINYNGFALPRMLIFLGKKFKYGKESKEYYTRLFNKNFGDFSKDKVHEKVELDGEAKKLKGAFYHYSYKNIEQYFKKFNSYTTEAATSLYNAGKIGRKPIVIVLGFPIYFLKNYFVNRNFLNGIPGFLWSLFSSLYPVIKYFKLWSYWVNGNKSGQPSTGSD
ncbi:MAG: glycosyltransferase family 2 protein [Ignavibacterium sp.]|nr:MAG: glycosyltransferase family 2 protein [Ignavibacterium sp.]